MRQFVRCGYWFSLLVQCFGVNVHSQDLVVAAVNNFPMYEKLFPLPRWRDLFSTPFLENVSHRLSLMSRSVVREYIFAVWQTMLASEVLGGGHSLPAFWLWFLHASTVECCSCLWFPKSKEIHHLTCARRWVRPGVWPEPGKLALLWIYRAVDICRIRLSRPLHVPPWICSSVWVDSALPFSFAIQRTTVLNAFLPHASWRLSLPGAAKN